MSKNIAPQKLLQDFLKKHNLGLQIQPQKIRRLEDGALLIEQPIVAVGELPKANGENKIQTQ